MSLIWSFDVDRERPKNKYQYESTRVVCSLNMMISGVLVSRSHWRVIIFLGLSQQSSKFPNSSFGRGVYSSRLEIKGAMNADGDSRLKRGLFVFLSLASGLHCSKVMLSASYTLTLKDQRIFISNTEFTWKTTWRTLWLWLCEITVSNFSFFFPLFYCSHAEIQKKHEQLSRKEQEKVLFAEKLTSLISEELQKGMAAQK